MRKALLLMGILVVGLLLVAGCGKKETSDTAKTGTLTVDGDASEVDVLDEELDTSDLDTLDSELDDLNW